MTERNGSRRRGRSLPLEEVATIQRHAFEHALKVSGISRERAAREMADVKRYTVQRYASGKSDVNSKFVLCSGHLWRPYWLCVGRLMHRAHSTKKRTAPRVASKHGKVTR